MRYLTVTFLMLAVAVPALAWDGEIAYSTPPGISMWVEPGSEATGTQMAGYVTQNIMIDTDTDWLSAQLVVLPDAPDQVYQELVVGNINPQAPLSPMFFPVYPGLEHDSWVWNGNYGVSVDLAAAVDLGYGAIVFDLDMIAIGWNTKELTETGIRSIAQITLAEGATGTWSLSVTSSPAEVGPIVTVGPDAELQGVIVGGEMHMVPEPATMSLLVLGGLGVLIRRKR